MHPVLSWNRTSFCSCFFNKSIKYLSLVNNLFIPLLTHTHYNTICRFCILSITFINKMLYNLIMTFYCFLIYCLGVGFIFNLPIEIFYYIPYFSAAIGHAAFTTAVNLGKCINHLFLVLVLIV